jgi:hypothetical protein
MRKRLIIDSARALVAVATLAVLLVGVPFGLAVFVGWPLPHGLPSLSEVWSALGSQSISDEVLVKTVAVVCWLAWAQLMLCAGAELAAWKKGEAAHRVRFAGALQPVMAQLVMSAAVLFHSMARTPAPAPPTLRAMPAVQLVSVPAVVPELPSHPADLELINKSVAAPDPRHEPKSYVVKARDDLWSLAEAHLGDPYRWKELFALNQGRTQPDGRTLQRANLVRPGWRLHQLDLSSQHHRLRIPPPHPKRVVRRICHRRNFRLRWRQSLSWNRPRTAPLRQRPSSNRPRPAPFRQRPSWNRSRPARLRQRPSCNRLRAAPRPQRPLWIQSRRTPLPHLLLPLQ